MSDPIYPSKTRLASIDLGSNSFHMMIVERSSSGSLAVLHRHKRKVQLRSGLSPEGLLSQAAQERALSCFAEFAEFLKLFKVDHVDAVGTYTLRAASGLELFLAKAEQILGHPIRVIPGEEEARLIYVGASQCRDLSTRHLIIDIGGGSTELIVGEANKILKLASLNMGSVSFQERFFLEGILNQTYFDQAISASRQLVSSVRAEFLSLGWRYCIGSSGTIQAVLSAIRSFVPGETEISLVHLETLMKKMIQMGSVKQINFSELRQDRENIFAGGLSLLLGLFYELKINSMSLSKGALREGILVEMIQKLFP